jgi:PAS domain S-box-containing protein
MSWLHLARPKARWLRFGMALGVSLGYALMVGVGFPVVGIAIVAALVTLLAALRLNQEATARGRLETALRQAEERARLLSEMPFEAIVIHDKGIILEANQSFCRMYGVEPSDIVGTSAMDLTAPESRPLVLQKIAAGDTRSYEAVALRKDGTSFHVELVGKPIVWNGRAARVTAIHDITERKQAEEALRQYSAELESRIAERTADLNCINQQLEHEITERKQSESLLRKIIDILPDYIFTKDREGRFTLINRSAAQVLGYDNPDAVIGQTDFDHLPREVAQKFYDEEQHLMQTGEPLLNREQLNFYAPNWFVTTKMPLRDEQGEIVGLVGIARDITERKRVLDALRDANDELEQRVAERTAELSEANASLREQIMERERIEEALEVERGLLRTLVDNLPHYVYYKDTQTRFVITNLATARGFGMDEVELIGKTDRELHPADLAAQYQAEELAILQTGQPLINYEEMMLDENGRPIWLLINKIPVRDKSGQVTGLVGFNINVTERKQIEAQKLELALAKEKANFLKDFLNNISHDFKTPLSIMNTSLYLLEKSNDPEYRSLKVETLKAQVQQLQEYIQDILTISRLDSLPEMATRPLDINPLIEDIERQFHASAEARHLTVHLLLENNLPPVAADAEELRRALVNLVENAVRYTLDGGSITVQTQARGGHVHIDVQDTGIGISEGDLPHIFESFYRADKARAMDTGGTGLGLAIVRRIIEMHGGAISVESTLGAGSTFHITLPMAQASENRTV